MFIFDVTWVFLRGESIYNVNVKVKSKCKSDSNKKNAGLMVYPNIFARMSSVGRDCMGKYQKLSIRLCRYEELIGACSFHFVLYDV